MDVKINLPKDTELKLIRGERIYIFREEEISSNISSSWDPELIVVRILDPLGISAGTGFVFDPDGGYIITAHHVIYLLEEIWIEYQGREIQVQYCKNLSDPYRDIAVLKCDPGELREDTPWVGWMERCEKHFGSEVDVWGFPADKTHYPDLFHVAGKLRPSHLLTPEHSSMESSLRALSARKSWNVPYYRQGCPLKVYYIEDCTVPEGMSGSPVALRGAVIGFVHGDSRQYVELFKKKFKKFDLDDDDLPYEGYIEGDRRVFVICASDVLNLLRRYLIGGDEL